MVSAASLRGSIIFLQIQPNNVFQSFTRFYNNLISFIDSFLFGILMSMFTTDHFTAELSVRVTTSSDFVVTNFTFFDCTTYTSCTECVSSSYPCDWCVDGHRCTHDTAENCRNDILVTGVNVSLAYPLNFYCCNKFDFILHYCIHQ